MLVGFFVLITRNSVEMWGLFFFLALVIEVATQPALRDQICFCGLETPALRSPVVWCDMKEPKLRTSVFIYPSVIPLICSRELEQQTCLGTVG